MTPNHDAHMRPAVMPTAMRELALHVQLAAAIHVTLVGLDCANLRYMYSCRLHPAVCAACARRRTHLGKPTPRSRSLIDLRRRPARPNHR